MFLWEHLKMIFFETIVMTRVIHFIHITPLETVIFCFPHFFLTGKVGDWKNHFTPQQQKMFEDDYKEQMKDVDIPFRNLI